MRYRLCKVLSTTRSTWHARNQTDRMNRWIIAVAALALTVACTAPSASTETTEPAPAKPPAHLIGTLNPDVTPATIARTICVPGWTAHIRPPTSYTTRLERQQIQRLHLPGTTADYEEDHLMPLSLGGAPRDPANLRPVPLAVAKKHDAWERLLHTRVCDGRMTLAEARLEMTRVKADLR